MNSETISLFPGMYRLDPVQSSLRCNMGLMTSNVGFLCAAKPIKDSHLADTESTLFGLSEGIPAQPLPVPVKETENYQVGPEQAHFLKTETRPRGPQREAQGTASRIIEYPWKPNYEPTDLYYGANSRQMFKV